MTIAKGIGFARTQFQEQADPPNEEEARSKVCTWIASHPQPTTFVFAAWRRWKKNRSVYTVVDESGTPHHSVAYDEICKCAFSHGGNESCINRHFIRSHSDRMAATDQDRSDWVGETADCDDIQVNRSLLRSNASLR